MVYPLEIEKLVQQAEDCALNADYPQTMEFLRDAVELAKKADIELDFWHVKRIIDTVYFIREYGEAEVSSENQ